MTDGVYDKHARAAYGAYCSSLDSGAPDFLDLDVREQHAWISAANAARDFRMPEPQPEERFTAEESQARRLPDLQPVKRTEKGEAK